MSHRYLVSESGIEAVQELGTCNGKYRITLDGRNYCYLEGLAKCRCQKMVKKARGKSAMTECTLKQAPSCVIGDLYVMPEMQNAM